MKFNPSQGHKTPLYGEVILNPAKNLLLKFLQTGKIL
ncbi:hypothetical protein HCUR_01370 [Holospora curviuscula]|uniref:Uncharacterized protein n=1 Tax=Holospora curviuscula TaxID=1082868 RepID=A0A2S5R7N5_9PROT|nr:hypothetical protein HCUR_01370 [Holospora curviuscula]